MAQEHWRDSLICLPLDDGPTQGFMGAGGVPGFQRQQRTPDRQNFKALSTLSRFSDGAFTGVTAIKSLHLDNNKLKSLPKSLELGTVTNLTISNNPWSCTCQLAPLRRWMDSSRNRPDAVCASPPSQKGKQVRDSPAFSGCRVKAKRAKKGTRH